MRAYITHPSIIKVNDISYTRKYKKHEYMLKPCFNISSSPQFERKSSAFVPTYAGSRLLCRKDLSKKPTVFIGMVGG